MKKRTIIILCTAAVVVAASVFMCSGPASKKDIVYETKKVDRGQVAEYVTATGTIEPVTEVEVGTQVSGIIDRIYVDFNSEVTKGMLIAEMDRITLQSELASARASYAGQKASYEYQKKTGYSTSVIRAFECIGRYQDQEQIDALPSYVTKDQLSVGDLIYVKKVNPNSIKVGDPITFVLNEDLVVATHRVIEVDAANQRFFTKGDANEVADANPVHFNNLIGKPVFSVPLIGYAANYIRHPPGTYVAIAAAAVIVLLAFWPDDDKKKNQPDWVGFLFVCEADFELPERPPEEVVGERVKMPRWGVFTKRYGTKQGAAGGSPRPTHRDYATAEGNEKSHPRNQGVCTKKMHRRNPQIPQGFLGIFHTRKQDANKNDATFHK